MKLSFSLICSDCNRRTKKMAARKRDGTFICRKCYRRECVFNRPMGMSIRDAFYNLVKYGTFNPPKKNEVRVSNPGVETQKG